MPDRRDLDRYRTNLREETDGAHVYRRMAAREPSAELAEVYRRLAEVEERHAAFWEAELERAGAPVPARRPSWRGRTLGWLAGRFGASMVLPTMAAKERANRGAYDDQPEAKGSALGSEERSHARLLGSISVGGIAGGALAQLEGRHRSVGGNALRAAVLGANDGLLSTFSLVMGVAGAAMSSSAILVAGLAGMLAGAFSMALGEWVSVQSSRELFEKQIREEAEELAVAPEEEKHELALIYQSKGIPEEQARAIAERLFVTRKSALDALVREEIGVDPEELGGSPWVAAATSFVLFVLGAAVPVVPFMLAGGTAAIVASAVASGLGLFLLGAAITLMTGRSVWRSGLRQLVLGAISAGITFGLGYLIGTQVG
jgi:vacuolar iron transporter family protein